MKKIIFGIFVIALFIATVPAEAAGLGVTDVMPNDARVMNYSAEIVGRWRVSEGYEYHERFSDGEVIEFFADGTGYKSLNDRDTTDFVWSVVVSMELNINMDEPYEEIEMIILSMVFNDFELRYYFIDDKNDSILWDSKLVLDQGAGPPLILVKH